jgi:O-antigen ligase
VTLASPASSLDALIPPDEAGNAVDRWTVAEHVAVLGALICVLWPVALAEGGREAGSAAMLALACSAAVVATRPWRHLTGRAWVLAPLVALVALAVLPLTGVGRNGAVAALGYGACVALLVAVASYARTPARRATVAAVLCAGGVAQFAWALVPWWGGGDPSVPMVGTYYWHNQLAVALLLPALLGASLAVGGKRPWRSAGWVAAPLAAAGVILSTSRATAACLVVGWLAVLTVAIVASSQRRQALVRGLAVTLLAVGVTVVLPGPPLFATSAAPFSGAAARSAEGETVATNTTYRSEFWREALLVARAHPVVGVGYGRVSIEAVPLVPSSWAFSPLAHSAPLQALGDGGLLLGGPVLVGLGALVLGLLRRVRPRPAGGADHALVAGASVAALALVAHSMVDTDWTYPGLAAQFGAVVGLALAARRPADVDRSPSGAVRGRVVLVSSALLVLALVTGAVAAWGQPFHVIDRQSVTGKAHL